MLFRSHVLFAPVVLQHSMMLQQPHLFHVFLQVPVPILLFMCLVEPAGLVVEERAQARRGRRGCGRGCGGGQVRGAAVPLNEIYDVRDVGNVPLPFKPTLPIGVHFGQRLLRNAMTRAVEFLNFFFTVK